MTLFKEVEQMSRNMTRIAQDYEQTIEMWRNQYSKLLKYKCSYSEEGKCHNCEIETKDDYLYCPHCGAKLVSENDYEIYCQMFGE